MDFEIKYKKGSEMPAVLTSVILQECTVSTKGRRDYQSQPTRDHAVSEIYIMASSFSSLQHNIPRSHILEPYTKSLSHKLSIL